MAELDVEDDPLGEGPEEGPVRKRAKRVLIDDIPEIIAVNVRSQEDHAAQSSCRPLPALSHDADSRPRHQLASGSSAAIEPGYRRLGIS